MNMAIDVAGTEQWGFCMPGSTAVTVLELMEVSDPAGIKKRDKREASGETR